MLASGRNAALPDAHRVFPRRAGRSPRQRSVIELSAGQPIIHLQNHRLAGGVLAPKGEEADLVPASVDLTAGQPVGPNQAQRPSRTEHDDLAVGVGSPDVDHAPSGPLPQVRLPIAREPATAGSRIDPVRSLPPHRRDVPPRALLQFPPGLGARTESRPWLATNRCSSRSWPGSPSRAAARTPERPQAQTHLGDTAQCVGVPMRALEDRVVVERGVPRQAQEATRPPCKDTQLSTSTWGPPLMTSPSTPSMLSSSASAAATGGRYQPLGGGGRRVRVLRSRAPRRRRMRLMVRTEGTVASPCSTNAAWMASAPTAPRSP